MYVKNFISLVVRCNNSLSNNAVIFMYKTEETAWKHTNAYQGGDDKMEIRGVRVKRFR